MRDQLPTLLLGGDPALLAKLRTQLTGLDAASIACREGSFEEGPRLVRESPPAIAMVVMDGDASGALALMEDITHVAPTAQVFALSHDGSTETIVKAMRAGASEFLNLPLEPPQVLKALIKVVALRRLAVPTAAGQIWTVYSPKGGAGVTTLAANLGVEVQSRGGKSVCLVDLDFQAGDLALFLNLTPAYTMLDIALNFRRLDSVFLQGTLTRHPSGLYLLAAAQQGPDAAPIAMDQVRAVLELLKSTYDVVIVDTARPLTDETIAALTCATRVLFVVELTLPFLRGYRRCVETFDSLGVAHERVDVIVSKHGGARAAVPLEEAQKTLELPVAHVLPRDDETALAAVNKGVPLAEVKASSPLRRAVAELATALLGRSGTTDGEAPKARRKSLLGGLFAS
jgi:pilus assembly protein CpaE